MFYVVKIVHWCNENVIPGVFLDGCFKTFTSHGSGKRAAEFRVVECGKQQILPLTRLISPKTVFAAF